jgi:hypothetical protein
MGYMSVMTVAVCGFCAGSEAVPIKTSITSPFNPVKILFIDDKCFLLSLTIVVFFLCYDSKITTFGRPARAALFITEFLVGQ